MEAGRQAGRQGGGQAGWRAKRERGTVSGQESQRTTPSQKAPSRGALAAVTAQDARARSRAPFEAARAAGQARMRGRTGAVAVPP